MAFTSSPARKLLELAKEFPQMETALKKLAQNGLNEPVKRLLLVAKANSLHLTHSEIRIVDTDLTPYQAQSQCVWAGTFAEYRIGTVLSDPADPYKHFAIYFPNERRALQGSFDITRMTCEFQ